MLQRIKGKKKEIICNKTVFRRSFFAKAFGLMFHSKISDEAHVFVFKYERPIALTMWFVFSSIDVVFLDEKKRIVEIKENFKPFTNYYPKKEALFILELPAGTVKGKKLKIGDVLSF